jgi:hypothetical protein
MIFKFLDETVMLAFDAITYPVRYPFIKMEEKKQEEDANRVRQIIETMYGKEINRMIDMYGLIGTEKVRVIFKDKTSIELNYTIENGQHIIEYK